MREFLLASLFYIPVGSIDTLSTKYTLSHCLNCYEANPAMAKAGIPIKLGTSIILAAGEKSFKHRKTMRVTWLILNVGLGAWNLHQMRKYGLQH